MLVLSDQEVEGLLGHRMLMDCARRALAQLSDGTASCPERTVAHGEHAGLECMSAYVPDGFGAKLITHAPSNPARGLPLHHGVLLIFDDRTGEPVALMSAHSLTAARTAAVTAVATDLLARSDATRLTIVGTGIQATSHLRALSGIREFESVTVVARNLSNAEPLLRSFPRAVATNDARAAVEQADIVCCCTSAESPVVFSEWVRDGTHVSSVGMGPEVDDALVARARLFAEGRAAVRAPYPSGSLEYADVDDGRIAELGEVLVGHRPGRLADHEVTFFKSVGVAVEDVVLGREVFADAVARGLGREIAI